MKAKFQALTWPWRVMVLLQVFLFVLFSILYAALGCPEGGWYLFGLGVFICAVNAVTDLFADELFRWNLRFQIRDPEDAEPSEWVLFSRWLGSIILTALALALFIIGLAV